MSANVHVIDHPLIRRHLTYMREATRGHEEFRHHLQAVARLMAADVTRDLETQTRVVETPLETTTGFELARPIVLVPILRAGLGMAEGLQQMLPDAAFGHIGLRRNEETLDPETYYCNLPDTTRFADTILVDPMLATGGSAVQAVQFLQEKGVERIRFVSLVSAPEGIERFHGVHPDIPIYTAAIDRGLNEVGYIVPGLGDAGDRYFGTT